MDRPRWRALGASVRGRSHEKTGLPCQDAHCWELLPDGSLMAAVGDGAGSASLGEVGAAVGVRTAVVSAVGGLAARQRQGADLNAGNGWEMLLSEALQSALAAVEAEAAQRGAKPRELASTLILLVATPEVVAAAQIGDGAAVVADAEGALLALTAPAAGEYLNETDFLVSPGALDAAQRKVWRGRAAHVSLFSDGLQMLALKMPGAAPHAPFFSPLFRFIGAVTDQAQAKEQLEAFLRSTGVRERTDDDLTLVLAALQ